MDGASDEQEWWVRRAVLSALAVLVVVTTVFAVMATAADDPAEDDEAAPDEVVTTFDPSEDISEGPLRLGRILVAGRHGDPVARPEHTLESYDEALAAGVDLIEVEVVMTEDGQLLVRGDNNLALSTDVAERSEFADRERTKTVDGVEATGFFSEDFTLDELRTLKAVEPDPDLRAESAGYDGDFGLVGFDDLLAHLAEKNAEDGTEVGVIVEPRHASYFRGLRLAMEPAIARSLRTARLTIEPERVTIESTDRRLLERLEGNLGDNVLSAFVVPADDADSLEPAAIADLPETVDAVFVEAGALAGLDAGVVFDRIHEARMAVGVYPISYENALLSDYFKNGADPAARGKIEELVSRLRSIGLDLVLSESPSELIEVAEEIEESESASPGEGS